MSEYRFVFDTNTVVSALLLRESISRQAFDRANQSGKIVLSLDVIAELNDVLGRTKFDRYIQASERYQFLALLVTVQPSEGLFHWSVTLAKPSEGCFTRETERLPLLVTKAILIDIDVTIHECRDPKDDKFLELALSSQADCLVTGDKDLLVLHPFRDIPILTPKAFLSHPW